MFKLILLASFLTGCISLDNSPKTKINSIYLVQCYQLGDNKVMPFDISDQIDNEVLFDNSMVVLEKDDFDGLLVKIDIYNNFEIVCTAEIASLK